MNERTDLRIELDLTQSVAASQAGVSLATWRRWEEDPESVSARTRSACEQVLASETEFSRAFRKSAAVFEAAWRNSPRLTPRQAYALASELNMWADGDISEWLGDPSEPLHQISPFHRFDLRVMMLVGESRAWAEAVRQRCYFLAEEIESGVLPFDREGPFIDELLLGAALDGAEELMTEMPELFDQIEARDPVDDEENENYLIGDGDWDIVSDGFDDLCRWDEWEVPLHSRHPLLPAILAERHPFNWFDQANATGPGYLQRLAGLVVED